MPKRFFKLADDVYVPHRWHLDAPTDSKYFSVRDMRIDKTRVGSAQVFRCEGWMSPLLVSEEIKAALERMGATGTRFEEV